MDAINKNVKIKIFASPKKQKPLDEGDGSRIAHVMHEQVLPSSKMEYLSMNIKVKRHPDYTPECLIAYMNRKQTYTTDVTRIDVDKDFNVLKLTPAYNDQNDYDEEDPMSMMPEHDPMEAIDFVVATPDPDIPSAIHTIDAIYDMATYKGYRVKKLVGPDACVSNYKHYMLKGIKGFVHIGHGYEGGIVLDDGRLRFNWFQGLPNRPLAPCVMYFDSSKVFNPPLMPEIMNAGTRTFIGGILNLHIGRSEEVCKTFWKNVLEKKEQMGNAIRLAEDTHAQLHGAHGIEGDRGLFKADKHVGIRAVNNRFVCATMGGGTNLIANRTWIRAWETFKLFYLAPDKVALQASNFKYLCAEGGGGRELVANRDQIGAWETFTIHKHANGRFSLQAFNGQYVCAEAGGAGILMANRKSIGDWETFRLMPLKHIALVNKKGKYVCAEDGGGRELIANRDLLRSWETFILTDMGNGQVALQCHNGTYICLEDAGKKPLMANRNWIRTWELFKMEMFKDGKCAFKAYNDKYITAKEGNPLMASSDKVGEDESFNLIEIDGDLNLELQARIEEHVHVTKGL